MVYREMDIGTAKPGAEILARCPHHLIDIRAPQNTYSAADFCHDARALIEAIHGRGRYPLLVGGTMFYFRTLEAGLPTLPQADPGVRRQLEARALRDGWTSLYQELTRLDPARAAQIEPGDRQRIQRALEIAILTGNTSAAGCVSRDAALVKNHLLCKLALAPADRMWLHRRIQRRFGAMLEQGLVEEVHKLLKNKELSTELPALRMVGYRQVIQYLNGELEYNEMERRGVAATRQLAKRQMTWLRNQPGVTWVDCASQLVEKSATEYIRSKLAVLGR